jgi:polyhydroxyalkanoate synthesis regulator phasin
VSTSAPRARLVDAFTGAKAPDKFFESLSEADDFIRRSDGVCELQARVDELQAEVAELRTLLAVARSERDVARAEGRRGW